MEQTEIMINAGSTEQSGVETAAGKRRLVTSALKPVVSAALIYWILKDTNLSEIVAAARSTNVPLLLLAFSLNFVGILISTQRWRLLLKAQGTTVPISFLIKSYIVGIFFNNFLPSTIGGDASRAYDSRDLVPSKAGAVAVIFVDRFLGLFALMLFALGALLFSNELTRSVPALVVWVPVAVVAMCAVVWVIFMPSRRLSIFIEQTRLPVLQSLQDTIVQAFVAFQDRKDTLLRALGLSLVLQTNVVIHYYLIARALGFSVPLYSFFLIVPVAIFIMTIPISINAIGVRENVFAFFLATYGVLKPEAVVFAWLAYSIVLIEGVIGGILYAVRK